MTDVVVPPFDLPDEHSLQAQFWLTPLGVTGRPMTLGSVRVNRDDDDHADRLRARVTHYAPPGRVKESIVDEFAFGWPRQHGRAGDVIGTALALGAAAREVPPTMVLRRDELEQLLALARRAPLSAGDRGDMERQVIADMERVLGLTPP